MSEKSEMERNYHYQQLVFMEGKTGDKDLEQLIYRGLYLNLGNEEYVNDIYKLIVKKAKRVKGKRYNYIGKGLIKNTSYMAHPWYYSEEEVEALINSK